MQAEWERMTHGSKAAAYAGKVGGNDPPTAAKQQQQHIQAEWEGVTLPQQQSSSSSIYRQSGRERSSHSSKSPALSPFTKYNQSI